MEEEGGNQRIIGRGKSGPFHVAFLGSKKRKKGGETPHPFTPIKITQQHPVMPFRMPFAGEGEFFSPDSVLSHCYGAFLPMFDTAEATVLRQLCREFKGTVAEFPWEDEKTVIMGSVAGWRACFPKARWGNVSGYVKLYNRRGRRTPMVDADFVHFVGLRKLNMGNCKGITDAAFVHLKGIHTLNMEYCSQSTITDAAFTHLKGIQRLNLYCCSQPTITDTAFTHLQGIHTLNMSKCTQFTDAAFTYLTGIHCFSMSGCTQPTITDAAFVHLKGINNLNILGCSQPSITDAAFAHLKGIRNLNMSYCCQPTITDLAFSHLKGIYILSIHGCTQLTSAVFSYLGGIQRLNIGSCPQLTLVEGTLTGILCINLYGHSQAQIDKAISWGLPFTKRKSRGIQL